MKSNFTTQNNICNKCIILNKNLMKIMEYLKYEVHQKYINKFADHFEMIIGYIYTYINIYLKM